MPTMSEILSTLKAAVVPSIPVIPPSIAALSPSELEAAGLQGNFFALDPVERGKIILGLAYAELPEVAEPEVAEPEVAEPEVAEPEVAEPDELIVEGDTITLNEAGHQLFGDSQQTALVLGVTDDSALVRWETGDESTISLSTIEKVPADEPADGADAGEADASDGSVG